MGRANRLLILATAWLWAGGALAEEIAPAVLFDIGGKFDKSFGEAAYRGAERFRSETGIGYREFEINTDAQREQALRNMARRGATIIASIGFAQRSAVEKLAPEFPKTKFVLIDAAVDQPNVQSILFREQEGAFLVGTLAALASKTGKIGFVGGMDIPLIRAFACGYLQGALHANPKIELLQNMTGTTSSAFRDPTRGAELARSQFDRGVDVVFAAAGTSGLGVLQAASDAKKLSIGVDSNQNPLYPGSVLTSMIKRVDVAVYKAFTDAKAGAWKPGTQVLGLAEDGIGWALDENNRPLVTPEMQQAVEQAKGAIIAHSLTVADYREGNSCPVK